jgi:hypothetical protein
VRSSSSRGFQAIETMPHDTPNDFFCFRNFNVMAGARCSSLILSGRRLDYIARVQLEFGENNGTFLGPDGKQVKWMLPGEWGGLCTIRIVPLLRVPSRVVKIRY